MKYNVDTVLNIIVSSAFVGLLINMTVLLVVNTWSSYNLSACKNAAYILTYFFVMFFCLIFLLRERIIKFSMSKEGISAELHKIEKTKEEIFDTKEEILGIKKELLNWYKNILKITVTLVENSKRWAGWSEQRYNKQIQDIYEKCKCLNVSEYELGEIFQTKTFWEKIDQINALKCKVESGIENADLKKELNNQWNKVVYSIDELSVEWLEKYIDKASFNESGKNKLREEIKFFGK